MSHRVLRILLLAAVVVSPLRLASAQTHVFNLNGTLADELGGPSLVAEGGTLTDAGYTFAANQGLTLSNVFHSGVNANDPWSIVLHYSLEDLSAFAKVIDFHNLSSTCFSFHFSDCGFFNGNWTHADQPVWYANAYGQEGAYAENVMGTTVFERNSVGTVKVYVNGVLQFTDGDNAHQQAVFYGADNIARFFEDPGTQASGGFVDYIATYDYALSGDEALAISENLSAVPEPASLVLFSSGLLLVAGVVRRRNRLTQAH